MATHEDPSHKNHQTSIDLFKTDKKYKWNFRVGWNYVKKSKNIWLPCLSRLTRGKVKICTKSAKTTLIFGFLAKSIPPWNDPTLWPFSYQRLIYWIHNSRSYEFFCNPLFFEMTWFFENSFSSFFIKNPFCKRLVWPRKVFGCMMMQYFCNLVL